MLLMLLRRCLTAPSSHVSRKNRLSGDHQTPSDVLIGYNVIEFFEDYIPGKFQQQPASSGSRDQMQNNPQPSAT